MSGYLARRLLQLVPVLFGISVLVFALMALLPGSPAQAILGSYATPENVERLNEELNLNGSLPERYVSWMGNVLTGDFGRSYSLNRPVTDEIGERLRATLLLSSAALVVAAVLGLASGVGAAIRQNRWQDRTLTVAALVGLSMPSFWLAMVMIVIFSLELGWFPAGNMTDAFGGGGVLDVLHHLVLPAVSLGLVATGVLSRFTRSSMLEVLRQDYVTTARSKGLTERQIVRSHAFRNARVNIVPILGVQVGFLLGGAVYIETVFNWPGIGRMLVDAIATRDLLLVQGGVLTLAVIYVLVNLGTDVVQAALDPRIRT
ncbi:MAG: ABC transporter permease [Actinomycetota bacterium]|nr:ABC transporter permease [Actinomycetota bacterium]